MNKTIQKSATESKTTTAADRIINEVSAEVRTLWSEAAAARGVTLREFVIKVYNMDGATPPAAPVVKLENPRETLCKLMQLDGITHQALKAVYVAAGHFPAPLEPEDLPEAYVEGLCDPEVWGRFCERAKAA